jgi:acyl-coenzyme A synthetase/AMP-(fatty) acid ligase
MLKVGGIWVSPVEVENVLVEHPAVLEAGVVGKEDHDKLIKPLAYVVLAPGHSGSAELGKELQGLRPRQTGRVQTPALGRVRRRTAQNGHRQNAALQITRAGVARI